jgi:hypothetical protein
MDDYEIGRERKKRAQSENETIARKGDGAVISFSLFIYICWEH